MEIWKLLSTPLMMCAVASCAAPLSTDQAELRNIKPSNRIPKSRPAQFIQAFDTFCISPASSRIERERSLRDADYVPTKPWQPGRPQVFLVDDRRPAIVLSDRACSARALSRTGQTEKVRDYVRKRFPHAQPLPTEQFGDDIEQVWQTSKAIIATEQGLTLDGHTSFAVTVFNLKGKI